MNFSLYILAGALAFLAMGIPARGQARSEEDLMIRLLAQLQSQNGVLHLREHIDYGRLWEAVLRHPEPEEVSELLAQPDKLKVFDPVYNEHFVRDFDRVIVKGLGMGIHWRDIMLARYELQPMVLTRDLKGLDKIIHNRFHGYMLVEDQLTRKRYVISLRDIIWMGELWFGAHVLNILEASSFDEFLEKQYEERNPRPKAPDTLKPEIPTGPKDPLAIDVEAFYAQEEEPESLESPGEVAERFYFRGHFDGEEEVELYLRGRKGSCPETSCFWEGMYKFLDREEFIRLRVTKEAPGQFLMKEDPELGWMELEWTGDELTGEWISTRDGTGYDVWLGLKQNILPDDYQRMDKIMKFGPWSDQ